MKKLALLILPLVALFTSLVMQVPAAHAANTSDVIDDGIFNKASTMSAADIDFWLNNYFGSSSCISPSSGFLTPDPQGFHNGAYQFGGNVSAGQAIYDIAQNYDINPWVILTTLQKEQSIITGSAGCHSNTPDPSNTFPCYINDNHPNGPCTTACPYSGGCMPIAMSYYCPGNCLATVEGFSLQISGGTWALRWAQERAYGNLTGYPGYDSGDESIHYLGPMTAGYRQRWNTDSSNYYDGTWTDSNGQTTTISNGATASLYSYTPFINDTNFSTIFQNWFGSPYNTYAAQPTWQAVYTDSSKTTNLGWGASLLPGQNAWVVLVMKNTGSVTWTNNSGSTPVRVVTYGPWGRQSPFCTSAWVIQCSRPAVMDEASIAPGQSGTFEFPVTAPTAPGTYSEAYSLIVDGVTTFSSGVAVVPFTVTPYSYNAQPVWQAVYADSSKSGTPTWNANFIPGQTGWAVVVMKNSSNFTWTKTGINAVRLITYGPWGRASSICYGAWLPVSPGCSRPAGLDESSVAPGNDGTFEFPFAAPAVPGVYNEPFSLIVDGQSVFSSGVVNLQVNVQPLAYTAQPVWQGVFTDSSKSTNLGWNATVSHYPANYWVVLVMKNTSNFTWTKNGGGYDVRLITYGSFGHQSVFCNANSGWIATNPICTRPATFDESNVPPGSNATFEFRVDTPFNPGAYNEAYGLIIDGRSTFTSGVANVQFTVQ